MQCLAAIGGADGKPGAELWGSIAETPLREYCHCSTGAACTSPKRAAAWLTRCMVWLHGAAHRQLQWVTLMKANNCAED